ncbi:RNA pseudouridine synthase [Sphingorhabdus sp. Alg239-R122]|uniref:RluA family pseudouridine synthase n=1 Tax=Sphingorhabdus sp. Alg239-R122 TaxID=2305989 RepID=UPI0013D8F6B9|nr:RNA pseudouridine synthase [Sphingorhabdus sp. Alg239-R122]
MLVLTPPKESELPYIDGEAIVIDKPAGLAVDRPKRGGPCLEDWLNELKFGFKRLPRPVHRLDQDTSGCLLLSRNPKALKRFAKAFENRQVTKRYIGILDGVVQDDHGMIELPLGKYSTAETGWKMIVDDAGKPARTGWRKIAQQDEMTLIEFMPETGRTHQIRAHSLYGLGHGLIGDPVYMGVDGTPQKEMKPLMLHSHYIRIDRDNKPPIEAYAQVPARFRNMGFSTDDLDIG